MEQAEREKNQRRFEEERERLEAEQCKRLREERLKWETYVRTPEGQVDTINRLTESAKQGLWFPIGGSLAGAALTGSLEGGLALGFICLMLEFFFSVYLINNWKDVVAIADHSIYDSLMMQQARAVFKFVVMGCLMMCLMGGAFIVSRN